MSAALETPRLSRTRQLASLTPEQRRARAVEAARAEERLYRAVLVAEIEGALAGEAPTLWLGRSPWVRAPLYLADYPQRANGGDVVLKAEALPDEFGDRRFTSNGLRIARLTASSGRSWLEISTTDQGSH